MTLELLVPIISAIGFGIQQFLQIIVDPVASLIISRIRHRSGETLPDGTKILPGGISDVDAKKAILGGTSFLLGIWITSSSEEIRILRALNITTLPAWDVFITALTISAGTEGANSVLKLVQYFKDAVKAKTPPSVAENSPVPQSPSRDLSSGDETDLHNAARDSVTPNTGDDEEAAAETSETPVFPTENLSEFEPLSAFSFAVPEVNQWRPAKSLLVLRDQVNTLAPGRNKKSDGFIGDKAHQGRQSDHNPWVRDGGIGVVTAFDITHDPARGCNARDIAEAIRTSRDRRVKYIIWNRRIANSAAIGGAAAWEWRHYTGKNPHTKHVHISVKADKPNYDSTERWGI